MDFRHVFLVYAQTENYGLFYATCEGQCTWAEFAKEIVSIMDISVSIKDIKSSEYGSNVQRPAYSVLENYMLKLTNGYVFSDWKDALKESLSNL